MTTRYLASFSCCLPLLESILPASHLHFLHSGPRHYNRSSCNTFLTGCHIFSPNSPTLWKKSDHISFSIKLKTVSLLFQNKSKTLYYGLKAFTCSGNKIQSQVKPLFPYFLNSSYSGLSPVFPLLCPTTGPLNMLVFSTRNVFFLVTWFPLFILPISSQMSLFFYTLNIYNFLFKNI